MRKIVCVIEVLILLITINTFLIAQDGSEKHSSLSSDNGNKETIDIILTGSAIGTNVILLFFPEPFFDEPLIQSGPSNLPYIEDTVPNWMVVTGWGTLLTGIILLPNNDGWMNHTTYTNAKGFFQSTLLTASLTSFGKKFFGFKRPDYEAREAEGRDLNEGRFSFWSGHSSMSFSMATYSSLYVIEHIGRWDNPYHAMGKIFLSTAFISTATYVTSTRTADNKHYPEDVFVGVFVGSFISATIYAFQNDWFHPKKKGIMEGDNAFHFTIQPNSVALSYSY